MKAKTAQEVTAVEATLRSKQLYPEGPIRTVMLELTARGASWQELVKATQTAAKKAGLKGDPKELLREAGQRNHGGVTAGTWPIWCGGDQPQGICGCERKCSYHADPAKPAPTREASAAPRRVPRCKGCRQDDHARHKATFRRKGILHECECAQCAAGATPATGPTGAPTGRRGRGRTPVPPAGPKPVGDPTGATAGKPAGGWTADQVALALGVPVRAVRVTVRKLRLRDPNEKGTRLLLDEQAIEVLRKELGAR